MYQEGWTFEYPMIAHGRDPPPTVPPPPMPPSERTARRADRDLIGKAARLHYEFGLTHREISEMLGISRRTLINRLDEYGIARPRKRDE